MARYKGPKQRISRRYGVPVFGPHKVLEKRAYPPGQHGPRARRKLTDYARGLAEKQKLRYMYGLLERQFRHIFNKALRKRGVTGETLLQTLETRLDNVAFRLGFANTRAFSRQLVVHGHIRVNGRKVSSPSYGVKVGDVIDIRDAEKTRTAVKKNLEATQMTVVPDWLTVDREAIKGEVKRIPTREEIAPIVNERLIVELYSR